MIELTLPLPNSANTHWRHARGIIYLSKQGREYRAAVFKAVNDAKLALKLKGRLSVELYIYPRDKRKTDIDNRIKAANDALQHAQVFEDDSQIDRLYVERREIVKGGKCIVIIREIKVE
jgi:crossover junction endodeoxyribonuclease RusA